MHSFANCGWVAKEDWLLSLELDGWQELQEWVTTYGGESVAGAISGRDEEALDADEEIASKLLEELLEVWDKVSADFTTKTTLELEPYYHCRGENASRNDDIDGLVYLVYGVTYTTEAAASHVIKGDINKATWVSHN